MIIQPKSRDGRYTQLAQLKAERAGISPKLSLYARLTTEIEALEREIGSNTDGVRVPMATSASGAALKYPNLNIKPTSKCASNHNSLCQTKNCGNNAKFAGMCKTCGGQKYHIYCTDHGARS